MRKRIITRNKFSTLDDPEPPSPAPEAMRTLDDPEPPPPEPPKVTPLPLDDPMVQRLMGRHKQQQRSKAMITVSLVLLILAALCFVLAAFNASVSARVNMTALGLFLWVASILVRPLTP